MTDKSEYVTPDTLEARAEAWDAVLAREGVRRRPFRLRFDASALLVVDMQRYFLDSGSHAFLPAARCILPNVQRLAACWREAGRPVVFTRHAVGRGEEPGMMGRWWRDTPVEGTPEAALCDELAELAGTAPVLRKTRYSAFARTGLEETLRQQGIEAVVIAGVMTHLCCDTTARDAFMRDLEVGVVTDATATVSEAFHLSALRTLGHGFAVLLRTGQALAGLGSGEAHA